MIDAPRETMRAAPLLFLLFLLLLLPGCAGRGICPPEVIAPDAVMVGQGINESGATFLYVTWALPQPQPAPKPAPEK